jgi:hypothetical protein
MLSDILRKRPSKEKYLSDSIQTDTVRYFGTDSGHTSRGVYTSLPDPYNMEVWTEETLIGKYGAKNIWEMQTWRW